MSAPFSLVSTGRPKRCRCTLEREPYVAADGRGGRVHFGSCPAISTDAAVIGSGPNGLSAAIALAQAGRSVVVYEAAERPGGGMRTESLTGPGFLNDVCSSIHPMAAASPFFRSLPLPEAGLQWIQPPAPVAHPLEDGTAVMLERSVDETAGALGDDAEGYAALMAPFVARWGDLVGDMLGPLRAPAHPWLAARFGLRALRSARALAGSRFSTTRGRALFAGIAAHSVLPLEAAASAAIGMMLGGAGHAVGWPLPSGGARSIAGALVKHLRSLGGEVRTGAEIRSLADVESGGPVLFDTSPRALVRIACDALPAGYARKLLAFRHGPGVFKIDYALDGPIPWRAAGCLRAATVHVGGTLEEIADSERAPWEGRHSPRPFLIVTQPSLFDASRAPAGKHTAWAYCHVPNGSTTDMRDPIELQIERFAPGFRARILSRHAMRCADLAAHNANYVGGDINGGAATLRQLFARPVSLLAPYATPNPRLFLCSASTPPGGGVHGMCGYFAARSALRRRG